MKNGKVTLRILVDRSSVEVFAERRPANHHRPDLPEPNSTRSSSSPPVVEPSSQVTIWQLIGLAVSLRRSGHGPTLVIPDGRRDHFSFRAVATRQPFWLVVITRTYRCSRLRHLPQLRVACCVPLGAAAAPTVTFYAWCVWGANWGAPWSNLGGCACTSVDFITARSPMCALATPPWHGRGQGFESPKLHPLFPLVRAESHSCDHSSQAAWVAPCLPNCLPNSPARHAETARPSPQRHG